MRHGLIAALVTAQIASGPAVAASFTADRTVGSRAGAFVGARLRVSLDARRREPVRLGLVAAPAVRSERSDGSRGLRFGEAVELRLSGNRPLALSIAGQPVTGSDAIGERRAGVSTLGWVGIGLGVVAVIFVGALVWCGEDNDCPPSE